LLAVSDNERRSTGPLSPKERHVMGEPTTHPPQDALSDSSICLLWRCVKCGSAQLGTLDRKPEQCPRCGGKQFENAAED
jgi:rubrerythrin